MKKSFLTSFDNFYKDKVLTKINFYILKR